MRVAARRGQGPDRLLGQPVRLPRAALVVQRQPAPVGAHEVDRARGAAGLEDVGEPDAPVAVQCADQLALVVVADQVEVVGAQAEGVHAERHEVPGLARAGLDPGPDHVAVGERERQFGDVDDRVHARTAEDEDVDVAAHVSSSLIPSGSLRPLGCEP